MHNTPHPRWKEVFTHWTCSMPHTFEHRPEGLRVKNRFPRCFDGHASCSYSLAACIRVFISMHTLSLQTLHLITLIVCHPCVVHVTATPLWACLLVKDPVLSGFL